MVEFTRVLFKALAEKYGGEGTLNELRVMNQIIRCRLQGRSCGVTAFHNVNRLIHARRLPVRSKSPERRVVIRPTRPGR